MSYRLTKKWWDNEETLTAMLVRHYGGKIVLAAKALGVKPSTVFSWRAIGVPSKFYSRLVRDGVCTKEEISSTNNRSMEAYAKLQKYQQAYYQMVTKNRRKGSKRLPMGKRAKQRAMVPHA